MDHKKINDVFDDITRYVRILMQEVENAECLSSDEIEVLCDHLQEEADLSVGIEANILETIKDNL